LCEQFDAVCRQVGRDPGQIEKSAGIRPALLAGSPKDTRARLQALVDVGVRHFILSLPPPYEPSLVRSFAREVMPAFR
jgi:alkanesulfonate monooxygenase SsuD/methylene tetrahydromethanopterin reductase-like flavin-dependent oxidoreductase (luciferase family)